MDYITTVNAADTSHHVAGFVLPVAAAGFFYAVTFFLARANRIAFPVYVRIFLAAWLAVGLTIAVVDLVENVRAFRNKTYSVVEGRVSDLRYNLKGAHYRVGGVEFQRNGYPTNMRILESEGLGEGRQVRITYIPRRGGGNKILRVEKPANNEPPR